MAAAGVVVPGSGSDVVSLEFLGLVSVGRSLNSSRGFTSVFLLLRKLVESCF